MSKILPHSRVGEFVGSVFFVGMHSKRLLSITNAVFGLLMGAQLSITSLGRHLAAALDKTPKHAIKQVDRLVGNHLFCPIAGANAFARWLCGPRPVLVVSLDWTVFDRDGHHTLALNLITRHSRATALLWKTYSVDKLKGRRSGYEMSILRRFKKLVDSKTKVTVLADRGFENQKLFKLIHKTLKWDYVIRLKGSTTLHTAPSIREPLSWIRLHLDKPRLFRGVRITAQGHHCPTLVLVKSSKAEQPWYLASSIDADAQTLIKLYAKRFTCEEQFRDTKDCRFGFGLKHHKVGTCERRDRLLLLNALATVLLTVLGAAGEQIGYDKKLRANTVQKRTHSLIRQGREYMLGVGSKFIVPIRETFEDLLDSLHNHCELLALC